MSTKKLSNISVAEFEAFLELAQCNYIDIKAGHVKYYRCDLRRPIIFQTHIKPIPEFIILNNLRILGYSKSDFFNILQGKVKVERNGANFLMIEVEPK
jgi:hypothetical protein